MSCMNNTPLRKGYQMIRIQHQESGNKITRNTLRGENEDKKLSLL